MSRRNDHTGAELVSKANTREYAEGYDRIFGRKSKKPELSEAELFAWLASLECVALYLEKDDHKTTHETAESVIVDSTNFDADDPEDVKAMIVGNVIWTLQIYPHTAVASYVWHGSTAKRVMQAAKAQYDAGEIK